MSNHIAQHRKGGRSAVSVSAVVATIGLLSSLLTIADHLVLSPPASPPPPVTLHLHVEPGTLGRMSDVDGLEEFGGLAQWRDVLLRFPGGHTEPHRLVAVDGQLPSEFKRPLNDARTAYERFVLSTQDVDTAVYEWRDIEER